MASTCKVARSYSLDLGSSSLAITTGWQGHGSNPVVVGSTPDSTEEELFVLCHEIKNILVRLIFQEKASIMGLKSVVMWAKHLL